MKVKRNHIGNAAVALFDSAEHGLGDIAPDLHEIAKAEVALHIMRCLAEGKKRITFEIVGGD